MPTFIDGNPLTALQLNTMIDALDLMEPGTDVPAPLFQRRSLDDDTEGTLNTQDRVWRYLIQHKAYNTKLYYRYEISEADDFNNPEVLLHVADIAAPYNLPTPNGTTITEGFINLSDRPVPIPAGNFYVVRFEIERDDATYIRLHWLYEGI